MECFELRDSDDDYLIVEDPDCEDEKVIAFAATSRNGCYLTADLVRQLILHLRGRLPEGERLIVLDPEDAVVRRFLHVHREAPWPSSDAGTVLAWVMREQIKPLVSEPTGIGAVVRADAERNLFVSLGGGEWKAAGTNGTITFPWASLGDPEVLHPGIDGVKG